MTEVHGYRLTDATDNTVRTESARIASTITPPLSETVTVVIDAHYPFHPSSGLVTNPAVVAGVIDHLTQQGHDVDIVAVTARWNDPAGCLRYLGYESIIDTPGVAVIEPRSGSRTTRTVHIDEETLVIGVPTSLNRDIVCLPTLRPGYPPAHPVGSWLLAQAALDREPTMNECIAYGASIEATGLLDATYAAFDTPKRLQSIFASTDFAALDYVADTFEKGTHSSVVKALHPQPPRLIGVNPEEIAEPVTGQRTPPETSSVISRGYQAYASMSGDLIPPQLMQSND